MTFVREIVQSCVGNVEVSEVVGNSKGTPKIGCFLVKCTIVG